MDMRPNPWSLEPGDILSMATNPDLWNHDAIYAGLQSWEENGVMYVGPTVVESTIQRGVNYTLVTEFYKVQHIAIQRLKDTQPNRNGITNQAIAYAKSKLGTPYDWLFQKYDDSLLYCSELIWHGYYYGDYRIDLDSNNGSIVVPGDIYLSSYLQVIYTD